MLKELTAWVLNQYFRRYVENLNVEQLSLALFKGRVELENLWLKEDALRDLELPLQLRKGYLGKIIIEIPSAQFWRQPWSISVERVYIIFGPNLNPKYDRDRERARNEERKRSQLESLETQWREQCEREPTGMTPSYWKSLAYKIVENLQLKWKDVHVRYEEDGKGSGLGCAWGVTIDSLTMLNADCNWEPVALGNSTEGKTEQKSERKLADLKNLAVYWDTKNDTFSDLPLSELKNKMQTVANHDYVLQRVDADARVRTNGRNEPLVSFLEPRFCCDFRLDEFNISLWQVQYESMTTFMSEFEKLVNIQRYRKWRPTSEIRGHIREWWQYLAAPLLARRALRRQRRCWPFVLHRARQNVSYVKNYSEYLLHPKDCSVQCKEQIKQTEKELDFATLKLLRHLAMEEVSRKRNEEWKIRHKSNKVQRGVTFLKNLFPQWGGWKKESGAHQLLERIPLSHPIEPPEEEFLESLFSTGEDESFLQRDAVFAKMSLVVLRGALRLIVDGMDDSASSPPISILELEFSDGSVAYEWRPRSDSSKLDVTLGTFRLSDRTARGTAFPALVASAFASAGDVRDGPCRKEEFFSLEYEKKPPESDLEAWIRVTAKPLEVVYDATAFDRWIGFVTGPHRKHRADLEVRPLPAADVEEDGWKRKNELGLFERHSKAFVASKKWGVYLNVAAPKVVFPEDLSDKNSAVLVCDFGRLGFYSHFSRPCVGNTDDIRGEEVSTKMADAEFVLSALSNSNQEKNGQSGSAERFYLELCGLRLVLWQNMDSWKQKDEQCVEDCIIEPFSISFQLERHLPSTDEYQQPNVTVTGNLPILSLHANEKKIAAIMSCLRELHSSMQWLTSTSHELGMKDSHRDKRSSDAKSGTGLNSLHILVVKFNLAELLLHVQSKGKNLVKMSINSVESTFKSTPSYIAASFTVQSLLVMDERRTFGSEHPFLMASQRMDCAEEEKLLVLEAKKHKPIHRIGSTNAESDVTTTASVSLKNLDVVVNREVISELMGLLELVFVGRKSSLHHNGYSLTLATSSSENVANIVKNLSAHTKMSFECNRLGLLLLVARLSNGTTTANKVATVTLASVRVDATTGSTLMFEGRLGGCHVKHFDSDRVDFQPILSFGYDLSPVFGVLQGGSEEALSFCVTMPIQGVDAGAAVASVALRMAPLIYCHSWTFCDDLATFVSRCAPDPFNESSTNFCVQRRLDFTEWVPFPKSSMAAVSDVLRRILIRRDDEPSNSIEANEGPTTIELDVLMEGLRMTLPLSASFNEMLEVDLGQISLTGKLPPVDATLGKSLPATPDRDGFVRASFALRGVNFCSEEPGSDSDGDHDADSSARSPSNASGTTRELLMEEVVFRLSVDWRIHRSDREPLPSLRLENSSSPSAGENRTIESRVDIHGWFENDIEVRSSKEEYRKVAKAVRRLMGYGEDRTTNRGVLPEFTSEKEEDAGRSRKEDSDAESTVSTTDSVLRCLLECPQLVVELTLPVETETGAMRLAVTDVVLDCGTSDFMIFEFALSLRSAILEHPIVTGRTGEDVSTNAPPEGTASSERKPRKFLEVSVARLTLFVVDERCDDFSSTYNSTGLFVDVDVQRLDLGVNLNTWKAVVAFFGSGPTLRGAGTAPESVRRGDEESAGARSREVGRSPWEAFSRRNLELEGKLGTVRLVLRRAEFDLAEATAVNVESRASRRGDRCVVRGTSRGLSARDASPNAGLYEERFTTVGHDPMAFCIVAGKRNSANEGDDYAVDLALDLPSTRCVHVHRFLAEWMAFVDEFLSASSSPCDEHRRGLLRLNVLVDSSTLTLPVHSASSELLVVELGTSKLSNGLVEADSSETIERATSGDRVDGDASTSTRCVLDEMDVELRTCNFFVGARGDSTSHLESGAENGRWDFGRFVVSRRGPPLLKETYERLRLQLKRNVSRGSGPSTPDVAVEVKWSDVRVSLDSAQYGTVFRVLDRNLTENVDAAVDAKDDGTRFWLRMNLEKTTIELWNGSHGPSDREVPRVRLVVDDAFLTSRTGYDLSTTVEWKSASAVVEDVGVCPEESLVLLRPIVGTSYGRPEVALRYRTSVSDPGTFRASFRSMRVALGLDGWTRLSAFLRAPLGTNGVADVEATVQNLGVDLRRRADRWARAFVVGARVRTSGDPSTGDFDATGSVGRLTIYAAASRDPLYEERLCLEGTEPTTFRFRRSGDAESGETNRLSSSFSLHVPASVRYVHAGGFTEEILDYFGREVAGRWDVDETTGPQGFRLGTPWHLAEWQVRLDDPVLVLPARTSSERVLVVDLRRVTLTDVFPETIADSAALPVGFVDLARKEEPLGPVAYVVLEGVGATLGDRVDRESLRRAESERSAIRFGSYGILRTDAPFLKEGACIYLKRVGGSDANLPTTIEGHAHHVHGSILPCQYRALSDVARSLRLENSTVAREEAEDAERRSRLSLSLTVLDSSLATSNSKEVPASTAVHFGRWRLNYEGFSDGTGEMALSIDDLSGSESGVEDRGAEYERSASLRPSAVRLRYDGSTDARRMNVELNDVRLSFDGWARLTEWVRVAAQLPTPGEDDSVGAVTSSNIDVRIDGAEIRVVEGPSKERYDVTLDGSLAVIREVSDGAVACRLPAVESGSLGDVAGEPTSAVRFDLRCRSDLSKVSLETKEGDLAEVTLTRCRLEYSEWVDHLRVGVRVDRLDLRDSTPSGRRCRERLSSTFDVAIKAATASVPYAGGSYDAALTVGFHAVRYVHVHDFSSKLVDAVRRLVGVVFSSTGSARERIRYALRYKMEATAVVVILPVCDGSIDATVVDVGRVRLQNSYVVVPDLSSDELLIRFQPDSPLETVTMDLRAVDAYTAEAGRRSSTTDPQKWETDFANPTNRCPLLKEKVDGTLEWKRHPPVASDPAEWRVCCRASRVHGRIDRRQYGIVSKIVRSNLLDRATTSKKVRSVETHATSPTAAEEALSPPLKFDLKMDDVSLECVVSSDADRSVDGAGWALWTVARSEWAFERDSKGAWIVEGRLHDAMASDTRDGIPAREVVHCVSSFPEGSRSPVHLCYDATETSRRWSLVLEGVRVAAALDWWTVALEFFAADGVASKRDASFWSIKSEREEGTARPSDVTVVVADSIVQFPEDSDSPEPKAFFMRLTAALTYRPQNFLAPLSCSLQRVEVVSRVLGEDDDASASVVEPTTVNVDVTALPSPGTGWELDHVVHVSAKTVDVGVSFRDVCALRRLLSTLWKRGERLGCRFFGERTENRKSASRDQSLEEDDAKPVGDVGVSESFGDGRRERLGASREIREDKNEDAVSICSAVSVGSSLSNTTKPFRIARVQVTIDDAFARLVDDGEGTDVPWMELAASGLEAEHLPGESAEGRATARLSGRFFDRALSGWQSMVEPWRASSNWKRIRRPPGRSWNVELKGEDIVNVNVTKAFFDGCRTLLDRWSEDDVATGAVEGERRYPSHGRRPFFPFALKNATGCPLKFAVITDTPNRASEGEASAADVLRREGIRVMPDTVIPFRGAPEREMRSSERGHAAHRIVVHVDGWHPTTPVTVDDVGTFYRDLRAEMSENSDTRIVVSVTLWKNIQKLVTVHSALELRNRLQSSADICLRRTGTRGGHPVIRRSLRPGEDWAVPLPNVTNDLLVRPEDDPLLAHETVRWQCVTSPGDVREICHTMMRTVPISRKYRLFVRVHRRRSLRDVDSAECCHVVTLLPPVTLINLLPVELVYEVRGEDDSRGRIPQGRRGVLHEVDLSSGVSLGLSFSTFRVPRDLRLPKNSPSFETVVRAEDLEGRALFLTCRVVGIHSGSSLEVYLSAPFWFVNKTGLPLIVRQEDVRSSAAGQYADHEVGSTSEPLPFSFSGGIAPERCVLRLGRRSLDDREPPWSMPFPLRGGFRASCVLHPSSLQHEARSYEIGIEVDAGRQRWKDVSIVSLVPRYYIYNNSFFHLQITQKCALVRLDFRKNLTSVDSDCCLPFYWPHPDQPRLLCVRAEGIGNRWSGGFHLDEVASFHVNIRSDDDAVLFLRVEVIRRGASYDVILGDDRGTGLPIRVDNRSGVSVACRQDPSETRAAWTTVPPYASVPYVPDEPKLSLKLRCRAPGGSSVVYDLARVGVAKDGLSYRDAFYVAFSAASSSSGDGDWREDDEPVLDVSDEGIAILNKKVLGKASQMWTFKGDTGLMENLGSLGDDSGLMETCLCLDIAGTVVDPYHPLPLMLREEDVGRSNTQMWHFSRDGRLHCSLPNFYVQCERTASGFGIGRPVVLAPSAKMLRVPASQVVRRRTILAEPGRLRVSIGHEGPTRVLQVDQSWDEETDSDDDHDDNASAYDEVDSGVAAEEAMGDESGGEHDLRISVSFPRGIGVSVVGSGLEELVYAVLDDVRMLIVRSSTDEIWTGTVRQLQVDDSLPDVAWPVLLCTTDEDAGRGYEAPRPAVDFRIQRAIELQEEAVVLNSVFLEHSDFVVKMDELLLWKLLQFFDYGSTENEGFDSVVENVWEKKRNLRAKALGMARRYYVDALRMASGTLRVSLATSRYLTPELKAMKRHSGWILAGFENVPVAFAPLCLKHLYGTGPVLMETISKHYRQELRENSVYLKIVGALDVLGNPLGLVADVSEGISAVFRRGDVSKLAKNVTHGISDSATKVTETLSEGIGLCALDAQHQETRRKIRREHRSGGGGRALVGGLKGLGHGIVGGVTSIVTRTYEGAMTGGVTGVVTGFGKGVVGTMAKPAAGMLDLASGTAEAVRETSRAGGGDRRAVPLRRRRHCSGPRGLLLDYSEADARAQELLLALGDRDCRERLVALEVLRSSKYDVLRILVSCTNVYVATFQELKSQGQEVIKVNLRDLHHCTVTSLMDGTTENYLLELLCTSPGLPPTTSGICSLKYKCDDKAAAQRACFAIAYAKKYNEERLYALSDLV